MTSGMGQVCPRCRDGILIELPSINRKMCHTCNAYFIWELDEGQKSVTLDGYVGKRDAEATKHVRDNR